VIVISWSATHTSFTPHWEADAELGATTRSSITCFPFSGVGGVRGKDIPSTKLLLASQAMALAVPGGLPRLRTCASDLCLFRSLGISLEASRLSQLAPEDQTQAALSRHQPGPLRFSPLYRAPACSSGSLNHQPRSNTTPQATDSRRERGRRASSTAAPVTLRAPRLASRLAPAPGPSQPASPPQPVTLTVRSSQTGHLFQSF
jgi:hypothetical protein